MKFFYKILKLAIIFVLIFNWVFGYPPVYENFWRAGIWQNPQIPPKIQEAQAAVAYQNKSEATDNDGEAFITISAPAGFSPGDLFIAIVVKDDDIATVLPTGETWTIIQEGVGAVGDAQSYFSVSYRIAEAGDTNWTWTGDTIERRYGTILRYTGQAASPIHASGKASGDTNAPTAPTVSYTDLETGSIALQCFGEDSEDTPYTTPGALTERYNNVAGGGNTGCGGSGGDKAISGTGTTGTAGFTMGGSDEWMAVTVVIEAAKAVTLSVEKTTANTSNTTLYKGETDQWMGTFGFLSTSDDTMTRIDITIYGSAAHADIDYIKLYVDDDSVYNTGTETQFGSDAACSGVETQITGSTAVSTTKKYIHVIFDIAAGATWNNTEGAKILINDDVVFSGGGTLTGAAKELGTGTIISDESSSSTATANSFQRKTWYDGARYWKAFNNGTEIQFWYSSDNGASWDHNTSATISVATNDFSIEIASDNSDLFIVYTDSYSVKANEDNNNYPATNFTWGGSPTTVYTGSGAADEYDYPAITKDSSNKVWITAVHHSGTDYIFKARQSTNANDVSAWETTVHSLDTSTSSNKYGTIVPLLTNNMYATWIDDATIEGKKYTSGGATKWIDGDYSHRKKITLSYATGAGSDYQVKLSIGDSSGGDFDLGGNCTSFPTDIRFTDDDETTELYYWIESTSSPATVWVKVTDSLESASKDIYIYYGKSADTDGSDGDNTFLFFDDFNTGSVPDSNKWTICSDPAGGSVVVSGGEVKITPPMEWGDKGIYSSTTFSDVFIVDAKIKWDEGASNDSERKGIYLTSAVSSSSCRDSDNFVSGDYSPYYNDYRHYTYSGGTGGSVTHSLTDDNPAAYRYFRVKYQSAETWFKRSTDNWATTTFTLTRDTNIPSTPHYLVLHCGAHPTKTNNVLFDYVFVRKYAAGDPGYSSVAAEQENPWGTAADPIATGLSGMSNNMSAVSDSSGYVHLAYIDGSNDVQYKKYTTSWQSAVGLDTAGTCTYPSIAIDTTGNNGLYAFWIRSENVYWKRGCSPYTSWGDLQTLEAAGANTNKWVSAGYSNFGTAKVFAEWTQGSGSPYSMKWQYAGTTACSAASPTLTFAISGDNTITFGNLNTASPRWAGDSAGSESESSAHTLTASTNSSNGYSITVKGDTLKDGGNSITAIGDTPTSVASGGTKQFGIRITSAGNNCAGSEVTPYNGAANMYGYNATASTADEIVSCSSASETTTYSIYYAGNIAGDTDQGDYTANFTYVCTGNF